MTRPRGPRCPAIPTRRGFLKASAALGGVFTFGAGCGSSSSKEDPAGDPLPPVPFDQVPQGQVTIVRAGTGADTTARALWLHGALGFIRPRQRVLVKPNFTGPLPPPDTTSPDVLLEVVRACFRAGAGEVIVAERTFAGSKTSFCFDLKLYEGGTRSMADYLADAGAVFRPLDDEPWDDVTLPGVVDYEVPLRVPRILKEVDHLINVPALKTHSIAVFTMTMKNFFGFVHPDVRTAQVHKHPKSDADPDREKRMFAQMNLAFHPTLNVLDAIVSRTTGGPMPPGDQADTGLVLVGKDRVAVDAVGLAILKVVGTEPWIEDKPVWAQVQLAEAVRLGVGIKGPDEITLVGDGVQELPEIEQRLREV